MIDRFRLSDRERRAVSVALYLLPVVLTLILVALVRDMWSPFRQMAVIFFLGWLLAFLLDPIVNWLVDHFPWLPRGPAAALSFVLVASVTVVLSGIVALSFANSISEVIEGGPSVEEALTDALASVQAWAASVGLPLDVPQMVNDLVSSTRAQLGDILTSALGGGLTILTMGTTISFIAVVMVASKSSFLSFSRRLVPGDRLDVYDTFSRAIDRSFGGYIRGQFGLAILYGLFVSLIALVFDVPFLPFIGVTTALLQTIPFFGQLVSWIPLVLVAFVFAPDQLLPVVAIMAGGWLVMQNVLAPRVMGSAVGLNPLLVLAAVFLGGAIAGPLGAIFGAPVLAALTSVFVAWLDHVRPAGSLPPPAEEIDLSDSDEGAREDEDAASPGAP